MNADPAQVLQDLKDAKNGDVVQLSCPSGCGMALLSTANPDLPKILASKPLCPRCGREIERQGRVH